MAIVLVDTEEADDSKPTADDLKKKLEGSGFVWVDLKHPDQTDQQILVSTFGMKEQSATEALRMKQRPRIIDLEPGLAMLVVYGLCEDESGPQELHILLTEKYVVTIHDAVLTGLQAVEERHRTQHPLAPQSPLVVLHQIVESLADGYFPRLAQLDDDIDDIEEQIFKEPTDEQLQRLFAMKRELIGMRRVVTPMRDLLGSVFTGVVELPGFTDEMSGWLRDAYDHAIRISDLIDSYRDLLTGAMDVYLSTVSNRLNTVMKQLTVIATVFLPLSFLTGFFGQNFLYLTNRIQAAWTFWVFGIGFELLIVLGMLYMFRRRKWI